MNFSKKRFAYPWLEVHYEPTIMKIKKATYRDLYCRSRQRYHLIGCAAIYHQQNELFVMCGEFENNKFDYERLRGNFKTWQLQMLKDRVDLYLMVNYFKLASNRLAVMK